MNNADIEDVIASANSLLSSIYNEFEWVGSPSRHRRPRRSREPTVSPEVRRAIDLIDRTIQDVPNAGEESVTESLESIPEEPAAIDNAAHAVEEPVNLTSQDDNLDVVFLVNDSDTVPRPAMEPPSRGSRVSHFNPETDVIDLCIESPQQIGGRIVGGTSSNRGPGDAPEVINLISPMHSVRIIPRTSTVTTATATTSRRRSRLSHNENSAPSEPPQKKSCSPQSKATTSRESNPEMLCAICMEVYTNRKPTATKCGHVFCKVCISRCLQMGPKCPKCRAKITERSLVRIHF